MKLKPKEVQELMGKTEVRRAQHTGEIAWAWQVCQIKETLKKSLGKRSGHKMVDKGQNQQGSKCLIRYNADSLNIF